MDTALQGKMLMAMPGLTEQTFAASVIMMCAHSADGAMGLIINKPLVGVSFLDLAGQIDLSALAPAQADELASIPVHMGGPVEQQRGFVLHSTDYAGEHTLQVNEALAVTSTLDILQDIAAGKGPRLYKLALGYSGWSPGQLENEIIHNGWLHCEPDMDLIFAGDPATMHTQALSALRIDAVNLSSVAGHA